MCTIGRPFIHAKKLSEAYKYSNRLYTLDRWFRLLKCCFITGKCDFYCAIHRAYIAKIFLPIHSLYIVEVFQDPWHLARRLDPAWAKFVNNVQTKNWFWGKKKMPGLHLAFGFWLGCCPDLESSNKNKNICLIFSKLSSNAEFLLESCEYTSLVYVYSWDQCTMYPQYAKPTRSINWSQWGGKLTKFVWKILFKM